MPNPRASVKFAVNGIHLHEQPAILVPVTLCASAMIHRKGTEQVAVFIPLPAGAVHPALAIAQFLGQLAVEMPRPITTVQLPAHLPDFRVDASIAVIKPLYAKFRHVNKSTVSAVRLRS